MSDKTTDTTPARDVIERALIERYEELSGEAGPRGFDGTRQILRALVAEGYSITRTETPKPTSDTYLAEDADGTPCLWLLTPGGNGRTELLYSKDDVRITLNVHKPNASWGAPSRDVYVDRLWDAIAATAGEPPAEAVEADKAHWGQVAFEATESLLLKAEEKLAAIKAEIESVPQEGYAPYLDHVLDIIAGSAAPEPAPEQVEADLAQDEQAEELVCAECGYPMDEGNHLVGCGDAGDPS